MKYVLFVGLACAALATGCTSSLPTSAVATTSASVPSTVTSTSRQSAPAGGVKNETRVASKRTESSLRSTAAEKSRCESGDDSACLVAGSFER